jgi:hypothetical protein
MQPRAALVLAIATAALLAPSLFLGTLPSNSSAQNAFWAEQFSAQFRAGTPYPRWMPESFNGLGAPTFYFYPPLPFWIDALLSVVTGNVLSVAYRLSIAWALLLWVSGWAMYVWLRSIADRRIALIGALAYMAAPYHLLDHYIRGAYAEFTAYAVLPLVMLGICRMAGKVRGGSILFAISYAALAMSHLPTALLISVTALPSYVLFRAWHAGDGRAAAGILLRGAAAGTLGLGLAAIYLVPALLLQDTISAEQLWIPGYSVHRWFLITSQNLSRPPDLMLMLDSIAAAWGLAAVGVVAGAFRHKADAARQSVVFWALLCLAGLLLLSGLVPWFWDIVPMVSKVQFPWRLLIVVEFSAITALCLLSWRTVGHSTRLLFAAAAIAFAPGFSVMIGGIVGRIDIALEGAAPPPREVKEYLPAGYPQRPDTAFDDVSLGPLESLPAITCLPQPRLCQAEQGRFGTMRIEVDANAPTAVVLRRFYFPAWQLEPPHSLVPSDPLRLVSFVAPAGHNIFRLDRHPMLVERWSWAVTGASIALLLAWAAAAWRGGPHD